MRFKLFIEQEQLLSELILRGKEEVEDGDLIVAYNKYIWVVTDENLEEITPEISEVLGTENAFDDLYDLETQIREDNPDVIIGNKNGSTLTLSTYGWRHQTNSDLLKKVAKHLGLEDIEVAVDDETIKVQIGEAKFYHGTSIKALNKMKGAGLSPQFNSNFGKIIHRDKVFVTANIEKAHFHALNAARKQRDYPIILEVEIPDASKLVLDYDVAMQMYDDETIEELGYDEVANNAGDHASKNKAVIARLEKYKSDIGKMLGVFGYKGRIPFNFIKYVIVDKNNLGQYVYSGEYGDEVDLENILPLSEWDREDIEQYRSIIDDIRQELENEMGNEDDEDIEEDVEVKNRNDEQRKYLPLLKKLKQQGKRPIDVDKILTYIMNMSKTGVSYSRGELNIKEIKNQLLQGGFYYVETELPLEKLYIKKETEDAIRRDELENPSKNEEQTPIVVSVVDGIEFFVVDGRHRVINAKDNKRQKIKAYIPLSLYDKYFSKNN